MSLDELTRCDRIAAAMIQARLEAEGISSFLFDAEMSWIGDALQCRIMVSEDDLERAREVLEAPA